MSEDLIIKKRMKLIQKAFPLYSIDRDGVNIAINCVNKKCSSHSRKDKKKLCLRVDNEYYHCWVCGFKGKGLSRFFKLYSNRFHQEAKELFEKNVREKEEEVKPSISLPEQFKLLSRKDMIRDPDLKACRAYAEKRGLTESKMWYFKVGAVSTGSLRRRIIIPSFDSDGQLNYYTARTIDDSPRKYMNPKANRVDIIFNEINLDWQKEITLVEGPFDLFQCNQNATCLLGSTLSEKHKLFNMIVRNCTPVLLALDADAGGKTQKIARLLSSYDVPVRVMDTSGFEDVGEMTIDEFKELSLKARPWSSNDRLRSLISTIKSGSLI